MRSRNPVFSRRGFSRDNGYAGFDTAPQAGGSRCRHAGQPVRAADGRPVRATRTRNPYAQQDLQHGAPPQAPATAGRMTIDDVVLRTASTLGVLILTAALSWALLPSTTPTSAVATASVSAPR
ncbi:membrane protein [Streptomyces purpurascens]